MIGSATTGAATWNSGGKYLWEINDADGTAGMNWDTWSLTGNLSIASSPFTIDVATLSGTSPGLMADFNNTSSYSWLLASTTGTISGFDNLQLDAADFQNPLAPTGRLYLSQSGDAKQLYLNYSPTGGGGLRGMSGGSENLSEVLEPGSLMLLASLGITLGAAMCLKKSLVYLQENRRDQENRM